MSTLWVREYGNIAALHPDSGGGAVGAPIPQEPGTDQAVTFTGTPGQSNAFAAGTKFLAITSDAGFHYLVGDNPTATTNNLRITAGQVIYVGVGATQKISAVAAA